MKKWIIVILLIIQATGCSLARKESGLLDCLIKSYENVGVDVMPLLNDLEKDLIEAGVLTSADGYSYHDYLQRLSKDGVPDEPQIDIAPYEALLSLVPGQLYSGCPDVKFTPTKKQRLLAEAFAALPQEANLSPKDVAHAIISVLSPSDFDSPYYRAITLIMIATLNTRHDTSLSALAPPASDYIPEVSDTMSIHIDDDNNFHLDSRAVSQEEAVSVLKDFVKTKKADHCINLSAAQGTSYLVYVTFQKKLLGIYDDVRNEEALKQTGRTFEELTKEEQDAIKDIYPIRINEI